MQKLVDYNPVQPGSEGAFTFKRGKFCNYLNQNTYFTRPYTSQDKGTVENRIGVIRRFFPKKTDIRFVTDEQIRDVENKINERPIRKFNYLNAKQVLQRKIALIN